MFKKGRIALILAAFTTLSIIISACGASTGGTTANTVTPTPTTNAGAPVCVSGTLQTGGSTALGPLVDDVAAAYSAKCSGASITTQKTGSSSGLSGVSSGNLAIGNSDIFADNTKYPGLVDHQVAVVVFAVVINSNVTGVTNLTSAQLKSIYTGQITNWSQVGGPNKPIVVISRPAGSGTRATFKQYVMGGTEESVTGAGHVTASTSGAVATDVNQTDGAISYDTIHFAQSQNLTVVKIDGASPTDSASVENNTYKFWNVEHMYTKGDASGLADAFINYLKGPGSAQNRQKDGFLDIASMSSSAIAAKQPAAA